MQSVTRELARIAKLEDALPHFQRSPVNLIEEEKDTAMAHAAANQSGGQKEVTSSSTFGRPKRSPSVICEARRSTTGSADRSRILIHNTGFANAVPPTQQDGVIRTCNVRKDEKKILEVDCHF